MDGFQRAWLDMKLAIAAYHAAEENEAQVAHWLIEGRASLADLLDARARVKQARAARSSVRRRYLRLSTLAADSAGTLAALAYRSR